MKRDSRTPARVINHTSQFALYHAAVENQEAATVSESARYAANPPPTQKSISTNINAPTNHATHSHTLAKIPSAGKVERRNSFNSKVSPHTIMTDSSTNADLWNCLGNSREPSFRKLGAAVTTS